MENKKIDLKNLKGTVDFLPEEQAVRDKIVDTLKNNFVKYGYMPLETPILNDFDLLKYKYQDGAEILNEIYRLSDQAHRQIGLRYDLTIPFCKVIGLNKNLTMPFRRYEIGKVFRDGPVKAGRAREFWQCDVDVVGIDGRYIEVEQMQMVKNIFAELGIDVVIKWNNRKLMTGIIQTIGIADDKIDAVIGLVDRLAKISKQELFEEFAKLQIDTGTAQKLLGMFEKSLDDLNLLFAESKNQNLASGLCECNDVQKYIEELDLAKNTQFEPKLARGLGIYTDTVFEFFDKEGRISSSLGGGGRYNKIITDFMDNGMQYPACGLSFGLEPIYYILSRQIETSFVDVLVVPMDTQIECLRLADNLRSLGARVVVDLVNKKVKKSFEYANKTKVKFVMVVGENEINSKTYSIKNMQTGEQKSMTRDALFEFVKQNI